MNTNELDDAVLKARIDGKSNVEIVSEAVQSGWSTEEISHAFKINKAGFFDLTKILLISTFFALVPTLFIYLLEIYNQEAVIKLINLKYYSTVVFILVFVLVFLSNLLYSLKNKSVFMKITNKQNLVTSLCFVLLLTLIPLASLLFEPSRPYESMSLSETHVAGQALFIIFFPIMALGNIYNAVILYISILLVKKIRS